jgi:hypothetical protein
MLTLGNTEAFCPSVVTEVMFAKWFMVRKFISFNRFPCSTQKKKSQNFAIRYWKNPGGTLNFYPFKIIYFFLGKPEEIIYLVRLKKSSRFSRGKKKKL